MCTIGKRWLSVSHHFGFGLLDAGAMVELAMEWQTVPQQRHCTVSAQFTERFVVNWSFTDSPLELHLAISEL